jgi:acyl-[acyl-carrier-protein]-phospholipid O-acyltransferase/long-chain-fatty-acid--[acyl-carrier-protein] ligase
LHETLGVPLELVIEALRASGLPNLFQPRRDQFFELEALPRTATGKIDLGALKGVAGERSGMTKSGAGD